MHGRLGAWVMGVAAAAAAGTGCVNLSGKGGAVSGSPSVIQTISSFNRPESCAFSLDGTELFVSNCASSPGGLREGLGAVSRLSVSRDGRLTMVAERFVEGLTAPLGIAVLPKGTGKYPAGTLFVNVGMAWVADAQGKRLADHRRLGTGVVAVDPVTGRQLGRIGMGKDTAVAALLGRPVLGPNGSCFDREGNLYVVDGGSGGRDLDPPVEGKPAVVRIEHGHIDALSEGKGDGGVSAVVTEPHVPNGVGYRASDDCVYFVTCDGGGPEGGPFSGQAAVISGIGPHRLSGPGSVRWTG